MSLVILVRKRPRLELGGRCLEIFTWVQIYIAMILRFTKRSFFDLCAMLRERAGLKDTFHVTVEEAVTIVLLVLSHGMKFRLIRSTYRLTLEPISRHFNEVLGAILSLSHEIIKLPDPTTELPEDHKWRWFPDGLGALDGTHVDVRVPLRKQGRYRNRKKAITTTFCVKLISN